ncbi:MAG: hypothetical protein GY853_16710 [PVC group bacterium]|nr:hypothetical protein [PVC group bacterium]
MIITIFKGNHSNISFRFTDSDGNNEDVSTWGITLNVNATKEAAVPSITLDSTNTPLEIDMTDAATGLIVAKFVPADTNALTVGEYIWDLRTVVGGEVITRIVDKFYIKGVVKV